MKTDTEDTKWYAITSQLLLTPCSPGDPASAASVPQNFGVWGLRHHFAIHEPEGGGLMDGLPGVAAVQSVAKAVTEDTTPVINSPEEKRETREVKKNKPDPTS